MALKKSQLYSSLWSCCDELRGGMDASQYKDYILTLLFMKYISDKYANNEWADIEVPKGASFDDVVALSGDKEIGDKLNKILGKIAKANADLSDVIRLVNFNNADHLGSGKEMMDKLSKLVNIFGGLDFSSNRADGDDLLGDAYEYLMRHFATESGKSKGQFYTPAEVSHIISKVVGVDAKTSSRKEVYDPTCGSGSLLLKVAHETNNKISIYGQENDNATYALCKMNMILHDNADAGIHKGNTLASPQMTESANKLRTFDFAVANPPFSLKAWSSGFESNTDKTVKDSFERFDGYGTPPAKNGDYAFLLHIVKSLKSKGKAAIILPHGVLFRGNAESEIRENLIKRGLIKGIIGLPANLFYGTGIPACIILIDKENAQARTGIFMIDASKGFIKDGNKNRLREQDIHRIVDVFNNQKPEDRYARMVLNSEIEQNDYNLNIPRYIDSSEPEDLHDLDAHLNGGIPERDIKALQPYWKVFGSLKNQLFENGERDGYFAAKVEPSEVKATILNNKKYKAYAEQIKDLMIGWQDAHRKRLTNLKADKVHPKQLIVDLAEDLLVRFADVPLLSSYDIYQQLMDYWEQEMQDDAYLINEDDWLEAAKPRQAIDDKKKKIKEVPHLTIKRDKYIMDLVPPALLVARYFGKEKTQVENLEAIYEEVKQKTEAFIEEQSATEDNWLEDAKTDKGAISKASVTKRLKDIKGSGSSEEIDILKRCKHLLEAEATAKKLAKDKQEELDLLTLHKYEKLAEKTIKEIVIEDKWFATMTAAAESEVQRIIQGLVKRVKLLEERYAATLPELSSEVDTLADKVTAHLEKMGVAIHG
ncbi:Type I restriction enzyme EcoKI M protein [Poriferisphaera corsica]|uniref:site-specific DNA-methyltransferase (adenine-specific) n=1 Tax=Poriferisphaera corsica TaxID=2528020 RepID=A0A517YPT2_9BACT|nr:type I restriction-modification system subunit M [Poriferisphaera corsica]QDU32208.1 Type I restriction enzyme EcoKI M protein [Poriferisphaera corsica]